MQIRIAIVIWWVGFLIFIGSLGCSIFGIIQLHRNQYVFQTCLEIQAKRESRDLLEREQTVSKNQTDVKPVTDAERSERMTRDFGAWLETHRNEPPKTICVLPTFDWWVLLVFTIPATFLCLALSFILGGRFWLPPSKS